MFLPFVSCLIFIIWVINGTNTEKGCVCDTMYEPVCCGGKDFGNFCEAECAGFEAEECQNHECVEDPSFNWQSALTELTEKKALWTANKMDEYVYKMRMSCYCLQCALADKYITIRNKTAVNVEFDKVMLRDSGYDCGSDDISTPYSDYFHSIDYYFDLAIKHAVNGLNANCSYDSNGDVIMNGNDICGGSITFTYDETLYFPTEISLNYGPFIADAGISYEFDCLSAGTQINEEECDDLYTGCICNEMYDPVFCGGQKFGNLCMAQCAGFEAEQCQNHEGIKIHVAVIVIVSIVIIVVIVGLIGFCWHRSRKNVETKEKHTELEEEEDIEGTVPSNQSIHLETIDPVR